MALDWGPQKISRTAARRTHHLRLITPRISSSMLSVSVTVAAVVETTRVHSFAYNAGKAETAIPTIVLIVHFSFPSRVTFFRWQSREKIQHTHTQKTSSFQLFRCSVCEWRMCFVGLPVRTCEL